MKDIIDVIIETIVGACAILLFTFVPGSIIGILSGAVSNDMVKAESFMTFMTIFVIGGLFWVALGGSYVVGRLFLGWRG